MYPLTVMLDEDSRQEIWQEYTADMLGHLMTAMAQFGGNRNPRVPLYSDVMSRRSMKPDNRTAEQIKSDILKNLTA